MIEYKFNEGALIQELQAYIDDTYKGHYSKNKFQSTEFIMDCGHGMGFSLGNLLKYAQRYGKKDGSNRKDLMKILHYALMALNQHDLDKSEAPDLNDLEFNDLNNLKYNISDINQYQYSLSIDSATPAEWDNASKNMKKRKN